MPRTGRPKSENPRNVPFNLRLTKDYADRLQKYADTLQTSRTEIIMRGIDLVKVELEQQNKTLPPTKQ